MFMVMDYGKGPVSQGLPWVDRETEAHKWNFTNAIFLFSGDQTEAPIMSQTLC